MVVLRRVPGRPRCDDGQIQHGQNEDCEYNDIVVLLQVNKEDKRHEASDLRSFTAEGTRRLGRGSAVAPSGMREGDHGHGTGYFGDTCRDQWLSHDGRPDCNLPSTHVTTFPYHYAAD